jgi:hypothetical protein
MLGATDAVARVIGLLWDPGPAGDSPARHDPEQIPLWRVVVSERLLQAGVALISDLRCHGLDLG